MAGTVDGFDRAEHGYTEEADLEGSNEAKRGKIARRFEAATRGVHTERKTDTQFGIRAR
jgi:hypothetical protein